MLNLPAFPPCLCTWVHRGRGVVKVSGHTLFRGMCLMCLAPWPHVLSTRKGRRILKVTPGSNRQVPDVMIDFGDILKPLQFLALKDSGNPNLSRQNPAQDDKSEFTHSGTQPRRSPNPDL